MESMSFKRGLKSKDALKIGINYLFWFGNYREGIDKNDGWSSMWINADFLKSRDMVKGKFIPYLDFMGKYSRLGVNNQLSYQLSLRIYDGKETFAVCFHRSFSKKTMKSLYKQLYNHLLEKI